jgi:hypothetical protein
MDRSTLVVFLIMLAALQQAAAAGTAERCVLAELFTSTS